MYPLSSQLLRQSLDKSMFLYLCRLLLLRPDDDLRKVPLRRLQQLWNNYWRKHLKLQGNSWLFHDVSQQQLIPKRMPKWLLLS